MNGARIFPKPLMDCRSLMSSSDILARPRLSGCSQNVLSAKFDGGGGNNISSLSQTSPLGAGSSPPRKYALIALVVQRDAIAEEQCYDEFNE